MKFHIYIHKYASKYVYTWERTDLLWAEKVWEQAATINSKSLATSCCNLVTVKLRSPPGQRILFHSSFIVSSKTGKVPDLLQTDLLPSLLIFACLFPLYWFCNRSLQECGRDFFFIFIYFETLKLRKILGHLRCHCFWRCVH